jgi:cellulose synthase/poly-beta-1,6-N-acetylglucosamine synthase-like glycosyltransferase
MTLFFLLSYSHSRDIKDPEPKRLPFVSVIITAYNEEKSITNSIKSVLQIDYPKDKYEIIVVDDGSTDRTFEILKAFAKKYGNVAVFKKKNGGAASAKNFGLKKAKGELITTLDADSFVSKGALKKLVGYFEEGPKIAGVTTSLNVHNPRGFLQNLQWAEYMVGIFLRKVFTKVDSVVVLPGPFSLYRKSFFDRYGGFEEGNITEDTEIGMRMQAHKYKIRNSMSASVYTITPNNFKALTLQRIRWYYGFVRNSVRYKRLFNVRKYGDLAMIILPSAFISVALTIAALAVAFNSVFLTIQGNIERFKVLGFSAFESLFHIKGSYIRESLIAFFANPFIFFIVAGLAVSFTWLILAKKGSGEKRSMKLAFLCFFFTYGFFYAFWWLATFIYRGILRKKIRWGPRYY